jgi:hypothetical protein
MEEKNNVMESTVETVDINIDEIFNGAATAEGITVPEEKKKNIFSKVDDTVDLNFETKSKDDDEDSDIAEVEQKGAELLNQLTNEDDDDDYSEPKKRGRKPIEGVSDVFQKLIKSEKLIPFDDDKPYEEYSVKDWEELIEANLEERANQVRRETPKQFFESLPEELQVAARYVAEGGQDLKGLFQTLAHTEEVRQLDVKDEYDQERIIFSYLRATNYGTDEEIAEEIETWKDLGKLEKQAAKFKPKLDKMQERVVAQRIKEQEIKRQQQERAAQSYMNNVYETLKDGNVNGIKLDKKSQALLYNGLVQPNYPSVSGKNTNLLGHLLEKYQFVEPNYPLIAEALWLLADPDSYRNKLMEKGSQKTVEETVRKLKTEQSNKTTTSQGIEKTDNYRKSNKAIKKPRNIFSRL